MLPAEPKLPMKSKALRATYLVILSGLWIFLMGKLVLNFYIDRADKTIYLSLATGLQDLPAEMEWMNILLNGKKVGYSYSSIQNDSSSGYIIENLIDFNTVIAGSQVQVITSSRARVDSNFHYQSFDWQIRSGIYNTHIMGVINEGLAQISRIESGDTVRMEFPVPQDIYPSQAVKHLLAQQGIKKGEKYILPVFEPMSREMTDLVITHEGRADLTIDSTIHNLNRIKIIYNDLPTYLWLDDNGISYREEGLLGMVLERTTVEDALASSINYSDFDLSDFYAIPVDGNIINPRQISELTLKIIGLPDLDQLSANVNEESDILELKLSSAPEPLTGNDISAYLDSNAIIQAKHGRIISHARTIIAGETEPLKQVQLLVDWVYGYLKKVPVANLASAVEILNQGVGDCSEHTTLFTALARSLDLPTRINMGVVYVDGKFLYHAWPSVLIDGYWHTVDPTFGQAVADATHLAFLEGDFTNLSELIPILGQIRIIIEDYR